MIPITRPWLPDLTEYHSALEEIWATRMLSNFGAYAQRLELLSAEYLGVPTRVVASGDVGLTLTLASLQLPEGSSCVVPAFTFNSTVNAVLWNRLLPIFVDIDAQTLNVDPQEVDRVARVSGARAIVATHVFGNPADVDSLSAVADSAEAKLLFDAAHGYGSQRCGIQVGNFGDAEVFSLSGTKPVTSAEGGLIASHDDGLLEQLTFRRGYGFQRDYNTRMLGLNGKMSELHAALGVLTLPRIEDAVSRRHSHVARYRELLSGIPELSFQAVRPQDRSTYKDFALIFPDTVTRDRVEDELARVAVETKRYFRPCHHMDAYRQFSDRPLRATEDVYSRILCVPLFEDLRDEEIDVITQTIRDALR